jgi:hypothetical protein
MRATECKRRNVFGGLGVTSVLAALCGVAVFDCTSAPLSPGGLGVDGAIPPDDSGAGQDSPSTSDTGVDARSDATLDAGTDSGPVTGQDAGTDADAGDSGHDADADAGDGDSGQDADAEAGTTCNTATAWPAMLAGPIIPLSSIANLNMNQAGPGVAPFSYAESVNCVPTFVPDAGDVYSDLAYWGGPNQDVQVNYTKSAPVNVFAVTVQGAYTGTLTFNSRTGGAFGTHAYSIGVGHLTRDGSPMTIDWAGGPGVAINEIADGLYATYAPNYPPVTHCGFVGDCLIVADDRSNPDGGPGNALFGVRPVKIYVGMPAGTSVPSLLYAYFDGAFGGDAGPGLSGDAGIPDPPAGCTPTGGITGSCALNSATACSTRLPGTSPYSCRDWPQHGFEVTCCPTDAGVTDAATD